LNDLVIRAEGLGKKYVIGHETEREPYTALRDVIGRRAKAVLRRTSDMLRGRAIVAGDITEEFWALKDVNFEIKRGEVVGIIGRNGAGKSTLLKILSRITEPTKGRVEIRGRVASLLEVGTGFHPELTGRENIYLNGAILGMSRTEIRRKFDEIVAFAEVERFLDTPVKRYSSGMYVRLAFAVAAHLEPEILVVDEVLAVGDAEFQKKCLGKMQDVAEHEGRTVLLVSHNLAAIGSLANRALLLEKGALTHSGKAVDAVSAFLSRGVRGTTYLTSKANTSSAPHFSKIELLTSEPGGTHQYGSPLELIFTIRHAESLNKACLTVQIMNQYQTAALMTYAYHPEVRFGRSSGWSRLKCHLPAPRLNVGNYNLRVFLSEPPGGVEHERLDGICPFEVVRTMDTVLWGWRAEHCAYHDDWSWEIMEEASPSCTQS
jgi:lipopolysaccharide transport system ATP-binding protein